MSHFEVILPTSIERVDYGKRNQPVAVAAHFRRYLLVARLCVAIRDGARAGDGRLVYLFGVHQCEQQRNGVVPQLAEGEMSEIGGQFHGALVRHAAAGVQEDALRTAQGLDRPLPVAAAADVRTYQLRLRVAAGQFGEVPAVRNAGLVLQNVVWVARVLQNRNPSSIANSTIGKTTGSVQVYSL